MNTTTAPTGAPARRPAALSVVGFVAVTLLWLAFGVAAVVAPGALDGLWRATRGWPMAAQGVLWVLCLPWILGLWLWQAPWALWLRLALTVGLALATIYAFYPREAGVGVAGRRPA